MKSLIKKILLIFLFLSAYSYAQDCFSTLIVKSDIKNAVVYIDTLNAGEGEEVTAQVSKGIHKITVLENSDRWDAQTFIDTLHVDDCNKTIRLNYKFHSQTYLETNPQDAYVYSNDSLIGHTPMFIGYNIKKVSLKKPGYSNTKVGINHSLKNQWVNLVFTGKPEEEIFINKPLFKYLLGGIVVFGGITAYYKIKADNRFNDYQTSGNNKYLDETNKYDLISGISFGAMQINFGLLLYYLLFN